MALCSIKDLLGGGHAPGSSVCVAGWVRTRRDSRAGFSFIALSDGSCFATLQVVAPDTLANYASEVRHLTAGCSLCAEGELVASPGHGQALELRATAITVLGRVDDPDTYPISAKRHSLEYLRDYAHLRVRTNLIGAVMRIRNTLSWAIHEYFQSHGFMWVATPIITASDCEGAGEQFTVTSLNLSRPEELPRTATGATDFAADFFGRHAYLTVSGQLNVEAYACACARVYTFGPTFRAENSNTSRHLAEFWMVEPEMAFTDLDGCAATAEALLRHVCRAVLERNGDDLDFIVQRVDAAARERLEHCAAADFARVDYAEALEILRHSGRSFESGPITWGMDLQSEHERFLAEEHFRSPVVVRNYPREIKAFYMRLNDDEATVAAMDVLAPGIGEIIGGSQREERLEVLDRRLAEAGLEREAYWWYRDLRRYGSVVHSGFGLGLERLVAYVTGVANVRDVIPFPRTPHNIAF